MTQQSTIVTTQQLAAILGVHAETVRKGVREDRIPAEGRGKFDLTKAVSAYCSHLRHLAAGWGSDDEAADLAKERALLAREQREAAALRNAQGRNELVKAADVLAEWQDILSLVRANMLTVPITAQQRLPHLTKYDVKILGDVVHDMLTRSADDDRSSEFVEPSRDRVGVASAAEEDAAT